MVFPVDDKRTPKVQIFNLEAGDALLIPSNYAHAYFTKTKDVILQYLMNKEYNALSYTGFHDANFIKSKFDSNNITISEKDISLPSIDLDFD
jgi:dTDP-4-dehydrorhamnose 3,5-epimerase-like enzyme